MENTILQMKLLHGLSNNIRYNILMILKDGEQNVTDLVKIVGGSQSAVSQHLACLRDCGLIVKRTEGKFYFYRLTTLKIIKILDLLNETINDFHWDEEFEVVKCHHHID